MGEAYVRAGCGGWPRGVTALVVLGLLTCGCDVYDASLLDDGGPSDAGVGGDAGAVCDPLHPPPRPDIEDSPDREPVLFAFRGVVLDQGMQWSEIGLDIDDRCTSSDSPEVECLSPASGRVEVDGMRGIDNAFGHRFYPVVELVLETFQQDARAAQENGRGTLLGIVDGWNGTPDDPRLGVTILQSVYGTPGDGSDTPPDVTLQDGVPTLPDDTEAPPPAWDGDDWWWVRDDGYLGGDMSRPKVHDTNAYIASGTLVVNLPPADILFFAGDAGARVRLTDGKIVAELSDDGQMLHDVTVAGRWPLSDLIATAPNVGVCNGTSEFDVLTNMLEDIADVLASPGTGGADARCDAISLGVLFETGIRARFAGTEESPPLPNPCEAGGM